MALGPYLARLRQMTDLQLRREVQSQVELLRFYRMRPDRDEKACCHHEECGDFARQEAARRGLTLAQPEREAS